MAEDVSGGRVLFYSVEGEPMFLYSSYDKSKRYYYNYEDMTDIQKVKKENNGKPDEEIIGILLEKGLCWM